MDTGCSHSRLLFSPGHLTREEQVKIPWNYVVVVKKINSEQVHFFRIFNYSTEDFNLPAHYKYLSVSLLKIKIGQNFQEVNNYHK